MNRLLVAMCVLALTLAGCADDGDGGVVADDATDTTTSTTEPMSTTTAAPADDPEVRLEVDGLLAGEDLLTFDTGGAAVVDAVAAILGEPTEEGDDPECPPGPATYARYGDGGDSLLLTIIDGSFVGWSLAGESDLRLQGGVGLGSTLAELEAVLGPVEMIPDSTLGTEFFVGTLSGLVEDDVVVALWAGANCIYR